RANPGESFKRQPGRGKVNGQNGGHQAAIEKANTLLIGGAMAYTFAKAEGIEIGKSRVEADKLDLARELLDFAKQKGVKLVLPVDALETQEFKAGAETRTTSGRAITPDWEGVDIGPKTIELFKKEIASAGTILW